MRLVLLHGLLRTHRSMRRLSLALERDGHEVHPVNYPSAQLPYGHLIRNVVDQLRSRGLADGGPDVGFIAHSLGGLIWRDLGRVAPGFSCGRSVVLGSPLRGSIVARTIGNGVVSRLIFGPALEELAAERVQEPSYPGPFVTVAGTRWTPLLPAAHVLRRVAPREQSDSTVLVREVRSGASEDHLAVDAVHTFLADAPATIAFAKAFLAGNRPPTAARSSPEREGTVTS